MSVKSRQKTLRREQEKPDNTLVLQKKAAAKAEKYIRENYLQSVLLVLLSCALVFLMGKTGGRSVRDLLVLLSVPMALALWLLVQFFWRHRFLRITGQAADTGEERREFVCCRVRFVTYPVSRFGGEFAGLVLIARGGKKYLYLFPQPQLDERSVRRALKKALCGQSVDCTCYAGTNVIKRLDNLAREGNCDD